MQSLFSLGPLVSFASEARNLAAGAIAGGVAATAVTPADVIKTRMQVSHGVATATAPSSAGVARSVLSESGMRGFFRGIGPRLARIPFYTAVTLATFELIKEAFLSHASASALG